MTLPSPHRTAAEVYQDHVQTLGPQLGPVYNALTNEVTSLHGKWNQYRKLFMGSPKRVDLLNEAAPYFFGVLQETLIENILLHLARLTDPPMSVGRSNLSLRQLPDLISDPGLKSNLVNLVDKAVASCAAPRDWRNRHLAHRDLSLAIATSGVPLAGISPGDISAALTTFREVLNRIEGHFWKGSHVGYEYFEGGLGDADTLVRVLQRGKSAYRAQDRRFQEGKPLPEDLEVEDDN